MIRPLHALPVVAGADRSGAADWTTKLETDVKMSIDQQDKLRASQDELENQQRSDSDKPDKSRKFELSLSQVIGGALAAMTAATLGSRLGSAGTVVGAAAASVVAAVSGAVYTASVRHTKEKVRTVWPVRWKTSGPATVQLVSDPTQPNAAAAPAQQLARGKRPGTSRPRLRLPWRSVVVGALLAFAVATVAITGLELVAGHALSGGDGTTISRVNRPDPSDGPTSTQQERNSKDNAPAASSEPSESGQPTESSSPAPEETRPSQETPSAAPTSSSRAPDDTRPAGPPSSEATG
jgi:hypothetical protein